MDSKEKVNDSVVGAAEVEVGDAKKKKKNTSIWDAARDAIRGNVNLFAPTGSYKAVVEHCYPMKSLWALKGGRMTASESSLDTLKDLDEPKQPLPTTRSGPGCKDKCFPSELYRGKETVSSVNDSGELS